MAADDAAVTVTLRANLKDYEAALKSAVRATEKAAAAAEKAVSNIGKKAPAGQQLAQNFQKSSQQIASDARIMQFQLNDIFSGLASGQGVRSLQMQLGQITQLLSGASLAQGAKTIGSALVGMVNPISLAVVAFGLAATAAADYFGSAEGGAEESAKDLQKHRDLIREVAKAYGDALPALKAFNDYLDAQEGKTKQADALGEAVKKAGDELKAALQGAGTEGIDKVLGMFKNFENLNIKPVIEQWELFKKHVEDGTVTVEESQKMATLLNTTLNKLPIGAGSELAIGFMKVLDPIQQLIKHIQNLNTELKTSSDTVADIINKSTKLTTLPPITSGAGVLNPSQTQLDIAGGTADVELTRAMLKSKAANKEIAASLDNLTDDAVRAFGKLFSILPESARITSGVRSRAKQAQLYADYKAGRGGLAAPPGHSRHEVGAALDIGQGVDMATLKEAVERTKELETLKGKAYAQDQVHVQLAGTQAKVEEDAALATQKRAESYADLLEQSRQATEMLTIEQKAMSESGGIVEDYGYKLTFAKQQQDLLNKAQAEGIELTPQVRAEIAGAADAYARATAVLKLHQEAAKASADRMKDQAQAAAQFSQQISQMAQSAFGGLINDLRNGVDAGEAFNNMLNRIIDSLIQMSIQSLFNPAGGGGVGGWLASLLGGTSVPAMAGGGIVGRTNSPRIKVDPRVFAGAPHFASGGIVGGGVPIIAHRGEMIVPRSQVGRGGSLTNNLGTVNIDMSGSGMVAAGTDQARQFGENVRKMIAVEMVRESRPGGLLRPIGGR
jgi:LAS superfamily LD-carboxypeptidase LdcB